MWDGFAFRDDDIFIATYAKSGTTWMQQIVGQLIFDGRAGVAPAEMSPWVDLRVPPREVKLAEIEAQTQSAVSQDAPARGRARVFARGEVRVRRSRRPRRELEHAQPPRQPDLVRNDQRLA